MAAHFSEASLKFLRGLARNNDREWFEPRKSVYEQELKAPMLAVIEEINQAMLKFAPGTRSTRAEVHDADLSGCALQQK